MIESCRAKAKDAADVIAAMNNIAGNKLAVGSFSTQVDMLLNYPSELKSFGSAIVECSQSLTKMLQMIHQARS